MRLALRLLIVAGLVPVLIGGTAAFGAVQVSPRSIGATVTGDASAYLALAANSASPHRCFVSESGTTGKLSISFAATTADCGANGGGLGINAASSAVAGNFTRYAFHDILQVTNKGLTTLNLWVNASSTTGTLDVAKKATTSSMTDADYAGTTSDSLTLAVGSSAYVGIRVNTTTLTSGSVTGTVHFVARK